MRTLAGGERGRMSAAHANFYWRVNVKDGANAWRELTNLSGFDWVDSIQWGDSIDAAVMTGSVTVKREIGALSLAPLVATSALNLIGGSYAPLLDAGRAILIETAITAPGTAPVGGDWKSAFEGFITDIGFETDPMTLTISDKGQQLVDLQIENELTYGDDSGVQLETVMQQILDANAGAGTYTLYVPVAPGSVGVVAAVKPYLQAKGGLLDALRTLALQIGWDVRYRYDASDVYRLTFFSTDRTKTTPDATIANTEWLALTRLAISNADVRNVARVTWQDKTTLAISSAEASDAGSIAEFGRRFIEFSYGSTNNIDTQPEAQAMAVVAVSDLSTPLADQAGEQFFFWPVVNGDLLTYVADGEHYTDDQTFGVVAFQHTLSLNSHRTNISVRGKIAGAYRRWLNTRNGIFPGGITTGPAPLIFPPQGELQAFEDPARDGMIWQQVKFDAQTKFIDIYAVESVANNAPIPELSAIRLSYHLQRQDGDQFNALDTDFLVGIATRANYYRKIAAIGIGADGSRGPMTVFEVQAVDVSTPPSAPPSSFAQVPAGTGTRLTWVNGDASAYTIVLRNGIGKIMEPGITAFLDSNLQPDITHTYQICHWKNGQTSGFPGSGGGTPAPPVTVPPTGGTGGGTAIAPTWLAGFPSGSGTNIAGFGWDSDPATTEIAIEISLFTIINVWNVAFVFTDGGHVPTGTTGSAQWAAGTVLNARIRALVNGVYLYSVPVRFTVGAAGSLTAPVAPTFSNGTPYRTGTGTFVDPYVTHVAWTLPAGLGATAIKVYGTTLSFPGVSPSLQYTETSGPAILSGSHDLSGSYVLVQLQAVYPGGIVKSGPLITTGFT